jgi:hypothetical protein
VPLEALPEINVTQVVIIEIFTIFEPKPKPVPKIAPHEIQ